MNNPQAVTAPRKTIRDLLNADSYKQEIAKVLPKHLTAERMTRVALTAINRTPKLLECTPESLMQAVMICSQAGLEPDGRLAHLIPYGKIVQVIFDWKGLVALGLRNGFESIYADVVCDNDKFDAWVEDGKKKLTHRVNWRKERGDTLLVYCVSMKGGVLDYEIMTFEETEAIRQRSRAKDSGPWVTDTVEMRKKCPIRRMSKRWDLLPEIRDVIMAEDDLPSDIPKQAYARPLFALPDSEPESAKELPQAAPPPAESQPAPESWAEAKAEPQGNGFNPLKDVRNLCKMSAVKEAELLAWMEQTGLTDGSAGDLGEVKENVLKIVSDRWKEVEKEIKSARAGEGKGLL